MCIRDRVEVPLREVTLVPLIYKKAGGADPSPFLSCFPTRIHVQNRAEMVVRYSGHCKGIPRNGVKLVQKWQT
jgi:hypothetical protein